MMYTLMHKTVEVATLDINVDAGSIHKVKEVFEPLHLPVGTTLLAGPDSGKPRLDRLNDWWVERSIPASRVGIKRALEELGVCSTRLLLEKCNGLSLSDQYWIRQSGSSRRWEEVNFFTNDFSKDVGEVLFGRKVQNPGELNLMSPDSTSVGWHRKRWFIADGKRYLLKGGEGVFRQEPFNEGVASEIMRRLGVFHVDYAIAHENGKPFSVCENFVTVETDLITAYRVAESLRRSHNDGKLAHLLRCCEQFGMPDVKTDLYKMIVVDYIIANQDRHNTNYGFIRNAETLEWLGVAPIFDSGSSLWYDTMEVGSEVDCMPFRSTHDEQIKLVKDFSWFDIDALQGIGDRARDIYSGSKTIDAARGKAIADAVMARAGRIAELARGKSLYGIKRHGRKALLKENHA
jgi:hypothetical protein